MNARNGKIARLPRSVRNELNERLERSEESPQLLAWLNALPEVKKLLQKDFAGVPISRQNLSEWRQGGFQEWLARRDLCEETRDVAHLADDLADASPDGVPADYAALVLTARLAGFLSRWNGEVDDPFEAKARVLNGLCRTVVELQRGMHRSIRESFEMQGMKEEKVKRDHEEEKRKLLAPIWSTLKVDAMAQMFGGGTAGRRIAKFILAVQNDRPAEGLLPTDKFAYEEPSPEEAKPTKPTRKERPVKQAGKTRARKVSNSLNTNDIGDKEESKISPVQSKSVKVNQSNLAPADDGELGAESGTDESKKSPENGSSFLCPSSPTSPTRPPRPPSPADDSGTRELKRVTELAEKGG